MLPSPVPVGLVKYNKLDNLLLSYFWICTFYIWLALAILASVGSLDSWGIVVTYKTVTDYLLQTNCVMPKIFRHFAKQFTCCRQIVQCLKSSGFHESFRQFMKYLAFGHIYYTSCLMHSGKLWNKRFMWLRLLLLAVLLRFLYKSALLSLSITFR